MSVCPYCNGGLKYRKDADNHTFEEYAVRCLSCRARFVLCGYEDCDDMFRDYSSIGYTGYRTTSWLPEFWSRVPVRTYHSGEPRCPSHPRWYGVSIEPIVRTPNENK